jgi:hypothetical protein
LSSGRVTRTESTRWIAGGCPVGTSKASWISLKQAKERYRFTAVELKARIEAGKLNTKVEVRGGSRTLLVPRQQCSQWRKQIGYTESQAAKLAGVTVAKFRRLLRGVNWRGTGAIPKLTVDAVIKRLKSQPGMTIPEAAKALRRTQAWIRERIQDGSVKVKRSPWDERRQYLTLPMVERLRRWKRPKKVKVLSDKWITPTLAAELAGVSTATIQAWSRSGELDKVPTPQGNRFRRASVKAMARRHWRVCRRGRRTPPDWLAGSLSERDGAARVH